MKKLLFVLILSVLAGLAAQDIAAQTKTRVQFAKGTTGTTVKGTVRGYAYRDHVVGALAGQLISVSVAGTPSQSVLTVFLPNGENMEGAAQMNDFSGALPADGDYGIRVGMMRSAARRSGSVSNYTLKISIK